MAKKWNRWIGWNRFPLICFLFFYLVTAFLTYRDYGITWDEYDSYVHGGTYLKHYLGLNSPDVEKKEVFSDEQASHNYLYPAMARVVCRKMVAENLHLFNLLFAVLIFWVVFEFLLEIFKKPWLAAVGPFLLYFSPRFSGDIPANPKDMPLAVLYVVCLVVFYFYPGSDQKKRGWWDILLGSLIGWTACIRILGITLLPLFALLRFLERFQRHSEEKKISFGSWLKAEIFHYAVILLSSQIWMAALWPYLGRNYFQACIRIFQASKDFSSIGRMLFMGRIIHTDDRLWYYLPVWLGVTLPLFVLAFFIYSLFSLGISRYSKVKKGCFVFCAALFVNLSIYWILRPIIYNGLRLFLFLIPIICVLAALGFGDLWLSISSRRIRSVLIILMGVNIALVVFQTVQIYPYQYLYFNELVGGFKGGATQFDADYWGASLKEASQWLASHELKDSTREYEVQTCADSWQQEYFLPKNAKSVRKEEARHQIPDYQIELQSVSILRPDDFTLTPDLRNRIIYTVERDGIPLAYVFKGLNH